MRFVLPTVAVAALLVAGCGWTHHRDDADGKGGASRDFAAAGFDSVALDGPDNVTVAVGPAASVRAEGDQEAIDKLKIEVVDGELRVGRERGEGSMNPLNWNRSRATVHVTMPAIKAAELSGAGKLTIDKVAAPEFEASVGGAGGMTIGRIDADRASFDISGAGGITVAGAAKAASMSLSGAGSVRAGELTVGTLKVSLSGVGNIDARATGRVEGEVSGVGRIRVSGTNDCHIQNSGVGSFKCGL